MIKVIIFRGKSNRKHKKNNNNLFLKSIDKKQTGFIKLKFVFLYKETKIIMIKKKIVVYKETKMADAIISFKKS